MSALDTETLRSAETRSPAGSPQSPENTRGRDVKLKNPFLRRTTLSQSLNEHTDYHSRWGRFLVDPVTARYISSRRIPAGLLLFDPGAPQSARRQVGFRMMFNGPHATMYGSFAAAPVMLLAVFVLPFHYGINLGIGLLTGLAAYGTLTLISSSVARPAWETVALWWPQQLRGQPRDPNLESVLDALEALDTDYQQQKITDAEYTHRWQGIYVRAGQLKNDYTREP